jgi:hypothetical protein
VVAPNIIGLILRPLVKSMLRWRFQTVDRRLDQYFSEPW